MKKDAVVKGGHGRGLQNKMSKTSKHNIDRKVDKRRRQEGKRKISGEREDSEAESMIQNALDNY